MKFKKIFLDLCWTCNYKCEFCRIGKFDSTKMIRLKDFKDFESYVKMADYINFTGTGESTLHPDFNQIVETIAKHKKKFEFSTNGSLLTSDKIKLLNDSNLSIFNISLNSLNKETYNHLTGGNLDIVLKNIDNIMTPEFINKKLFDGSKRYIQCSFVINKLNFHEIKDFIDFGVKYKINIRLFDLTTNIKDYDSELILENNEENRNYLEECKIYAAQFLCKFHPFAFNIRREVKENDSVVENNEELLKEMIKKCDYIDNIIFVGADKKVYSCCWNRTPMGSVDKNTLEEIVNGETYKDLRENIKIGSGKYCSSCRRGEF